MHALWLLPAAPEQNTWSLSRKSPLVLNIKAHDVVCCKTIEGSALFDISVVAMVKG